MDTTTVRGKVELFDSHGVLGWVRVDDGIKKATLLLTLDGIEIASAVADGFRADLHVNGDGCYQFHLALPAPLSELEMQRVKLRFAESDVLIELPRPQPISTPAPGREEMDGLWIDQIDWLDSLALRHRLGKCSDLQAAQIFQFVRDGYLVIPAAVPREVIQQINADIDDIWDGRRPGAKIETFESDGQLKIIDVDRRYRDGRTKLLDLYVLSPAARVALQSDAILSFLSAIFDGPPQAFQGLAFWRGSQQPMHKDTAYVRVDGNARALAATWLALEDIQPGSGELEYYVGSHRAPEFKFGGHSKWMKTEVADYSSEHERFLASLHADAERFRHARARFLGHAGDVLIWHADLAHGGSAITQPELTRKSFVTHFLPERYRPHFLSSRKPTSSREGGVNFISQYTAKFVPAGR